MFRAGGYSYSFDPTGMCQECDTFTCFHCNTIVKVPTKSKPEDIGGLCKICMKMICPSCVDQGCTPFEKKIEALEARDRTLRSYEG